MGVENNNKTEKLIWGVGIGAPVILTAFSVLSGEVTSKVGLTLLSAGLSLGII